MDREASSETCLQFSMDREDRRAPGCWIWKASFDGNYLFFGPEPCRLQAFPKVHACAIKNDPAIGRGYARFLTDIAGVHAHQLSHREHARGLGRELGIALVERFPETSLLETAFGVLPGRRQSMPVVGSGPVKKSGRQNRVRLLRPEPLAPAFHAIAGETDR